MSYQKLDDSSHPGAGRAQAPPEMAGQAPPMAAGQGQPVYQPPQYQQPPQQQYAPVYPTYQQPPGAAPGQFTGYPGQAPQQRQVPTAYAQPVYQATVIVPGQPVLPPSQFGPCAGVGHMITEDFTCCGVCLGIVFFPIGLICCLTMKERRCVNCGMTF